MAVSEIFRMINEIWLLACTALVLLMQVGFLVLEAGMTRRKNNANLAVKNLLDTGFSILLFWLFGFGVMFGATWSGWGVVGSTNFIPDLSSMQEVVSESFPVSGASFFLFQAMFCGTAVTILSGATAERLRLEGYLIVIAIVAGLIYPLYGHWAWGGVQGGVPQGWLAQLGFVDFAGSTVVYSVGGWSALALLVLIGPRYGRFGADRKPQPWPQSNAALAAAGALLLWCGWLGFNGGSALFAEQRAAVILMNTVLAGAAGMVAVVPLSILAWRGSINANTLANGVLSGLVAVTASAHAVEPYQAFIIGLIGGWIGWVLARLLLAWRIDDAVGAVSVHVGAGVWGTLAVALYGNLSVLNTGLTRLEQLLVQGMGVGVAAVWSFMVMWLVAGTLHQLSSLRVSQAEELEGLNRAEQGAVPDYSDFPTELLEQWLRTHRAESNPRALDGNGRGAEAFARDDLRPLSQQRSSSRT